jgi:uncharacterized PurR-regulated membrane protein YhhQ (DUF165 family)
MVWLALFIGTVFGANWAIDTFGFVPVGFGLEAPAGVYFAGLAFTFRDLIHRTIGKWWTLVGIAIGAALSYLISPAFAVASGVAFLFSELADFAVYTPLWERRWLVAVAASNTVGLVVDSALFLWLAFGSLDNIEGLIVGKVWVTAASVLVLWWWRRVRPRQ